jgi:hypothetical protein
VRPLPWRRPRYELTLLALVAVAALTPVYVLDAQDISRLCLTGALEHGHLSADKCLEFALDKSQYAGHLYTDKAPGMSAIELAPAELVRMRTNDLGDRDPKLWAVRVLSSGLAFLLCAFLVGRVGEGLAPGRGGATLVAFGLGTLVAPFAAANFGHITAAVLGFGAFLLAWKHRHLLAGLLVGAAVLVEYQAAGIALILGVYVAVRGVRRLLIYAAGVVPGVALLLVYNTLAFGAPWHLSYKYIANGYVFAQNQGVFGVGLPKLYSTYEVFSGPGGLLVVSPVLVAAAWGLVLLGRSHRAEAVVCAAVALFFLVINCGYFLPYGGISPGPRFLIPALPFLAVGLAPAFRWRPRLTALLSVLSVVAMVGLTLVWSSSPHLHRTIWWELAHVPTQGSASRFVSYLAENALTWIVAGRIGAAVVVALAAAAALVVALRSLPRGAHSSRRATVVVLVSLCAIAIADTSALAEFPYRNHVVKVPALLYTKITASTPFELPHGEVDFAISVENPSLNVVPAALLEIELPAGLRLLGPPAFESGSGCKGTTRLTCNLEYVDGLYTTTIRFGTVVLAGAAPEQKVVAWASSEGVSDPHVSVTIATR